MLKMVHGTKGEALLWPMVRYAQASSHDAVCRAILMTHLGEPVVDNMENLLQQYDGTYTERRDVGRHCQTVAKLLALKVHDQGEKITMSMLVKEWRSKSKGSPKWYVVPFSRPLLYDGSSFARLACFHDSLREHHNSVQDFPPSTDGLSNEECERIIISMLLESVFEPKVVWGAYE